VKRRDFITLLGGAAATWPLGVQAQTPLPVVGLLSGVQLEDRDFAAVRKGLEEAGYIEGRNVAITYRSADGHYDRLPALAGDLVSRQVAVIVAIRGTATAFAAKNASTTLPVVFANGADPIKLGLVVSLNRPGGNVTGISILTNQLAAKRLQLLHELVPTATTIGLLANPANPSAETDTRDLLAAAGALGLPIRSETINSERDFDAAFARFREQQVHAVFVAADAFFSSRRDLIVATAARHAMPAAYSLRGYAEAGGLLSYGTNIADANRLAGGYAARILKGEKPADLPVMQSTRSELVINLATAKTLGLTIPITLQAIADEVIE
jgi:putative tryptophan/tyrosine transport system substrate-binding protein